MKRLLFMILLAGVTLAVSSQGLTPIPNGDFETWIDYGAYDNPQYWDTPNAELSSIPFFGTTVVNKSPDHQSGVCSAKLETKSITLVGAVPGVVTLGNLNIDIATMSYTLSGGVPITDKPTHLKGYFKYLPKGGDSCAIGIGLMQWTGLGRDSVAYGVFSTKQNVPDWTPFSIWIDYSNQNQPDTMNILALSSAQEVSTAGTVLYIDNLYLDYTVAENEPDPAAGIQVYNDLETKRLLIFTDFFSPQSLVVNLYNMKGQRVSSENRGLVSNERFIVPYDLYSDGIYVLEVLHGKYRFTRKYYLAK